MASCAHLHRVCAIRKAAGQSASCSLCIGSGSLAFVAADEDKGFCTVKQGIRGCCCTAHSGTCTRMTSTSLSRNQGGFISYAVNMRLAAFVMGRWMVGLLVALYLAKTQFQAG